MSKIDINEFRQVLGVGTLYPDSQLQDSIDSADTLIDGLLEYKRASIVSWEIYKGKVILTTATPHWFSVGESIAVTGIDGTINGTKTITDVDVYTLQFATNLPDQSIRYARPYGSALLASQVAMYDTTPAVREAAIMVAVEIFQSKLTASGQVQSVDFTMRTSYPTGRALLNRVHGLLSPYMDMEARIG